MVSTPAAAHTGVTRADSARVVVDSASAGNNHATAVQPFPSRASEPSPMSTTVLPTTATLRSSSSRSSEYGAATASSCAGSAIRPYAAATPATGSIGASVRYTSRPSADASAAATANATAAASEPSHDVVSDGVAASSRAVSSPTPRRTRVRSNHGSDATSTRSSTSSQIAAGGRGPRPARAAPGSPRTS